MKAKTFKWRHALWLAIFLFSLLCQGQNAMAQEIPNGDGDLLWERPLKGRNVNDAKFHPINGNIIAAVNHEIWEIDPKDGHTIRVFEGSGSSSGSDKDQFKTVFITSDGSTVITGDGSGIDGLILWDYNTGKLKRIFSTEKPDSYSDNLGIYPDNNRIIFYSVRQINQNYLRKINIYSIESNEIIKEINLGSKNVERLALSNDGTYLALGISDHSTGDWTYSMELWDAETLTNIQTLGNFKTGDYQDIQFSNDNQYIGFSFSPAGFILFRKSNELYTKYFANTLPIFPYNFCISLTNKLFLNTFREDINYDATYIINLDNLDSIYKYPHCGYPILRINNSRELFTIGFDTIVGVKMQFYSNKWYEVGVKNPIEIMMGIINTNYKENTLFLTTSGIDLVTSIYITDTLGKKIYVQNETPILNNKIEIPLFLPSGYYLLKIISNSMEYTSKFVVAR